METTTVCTGLSCLDCGETVEADTDRCPACEGALEPTYDEGKLAEAWEQAKGDTARGRGRFGDLLSLPGSAGVGLGEGASPLVSCPDLTQEFGCETVLVKDEAGNPTGSIADRGIALAVSAARKAGAETVALPTTGNGGQAAAAYASRAGLDSESFVPSRTLFANKAMINVHGGEMSVVGGRYPDAVAAFEDATATSEWHSLAPFETPYRHDGHRTLAYELVDELEQEPEAVVCPTAHGLWIRGIYAGFRDLAAIGVIDAVPRLYAAQAGGCAPVVDAWEKGRTDVEAVEHPDTICGPLEIPDPAGGRYVIEALEATGGGAVGTDDEAILEAAVGLAAAGVPTSATGGTAVSGAQALAEQGAFEPGETVVLVNPTTANREADLLRSHLMSKGV